MECSGAGFAGLACAERLKRHEMNYDLRKVFTEVFGSDYTGCATCTVLLG